MFPWSKNTTENTKTDDNVITIPAVALRGLTVIPGTVIHFDLSRPKSISSVERAMMQDNQIFLVTQKDSNINDPGAENVYSVGCIASVNQIVKLPGEIVRVLVEGKSRGRLLSFDTSEEGILFANVVRISDSPSGNNVDQEKALLHEAMLRNLKEKYAEYAGINSKTDKNLANQSTGGLEALIDRIGANIPVPFDKKQGILEGETVNERYETLMNILSEEIQIARIRSDMQKGVREAVEKNQKEYVLREQMKYIRDELGDSVDTDSDAERYMDELMELAAPDEIKDKIQKEIKRFRSLSGSSSESAVSRGYIETLLELPWSYGRKENSDIKNAQRILDEDHFGLTKVKERMIEFLVVRKLTKKGESPIICLVGPPGTGKTSIARSIARALDKEYVRICLGGVKDEAEIRGHRRTYIGAMPGRIITALRDSGVNNPLMLLDEIDKMSDDYKGDPASALLEVLDSEQNIHFKDHYIELPVDLSNVLFIATANDASAIPRPLYDRMEIVEVSGYTANEKLHIANEHLVDKQLAKNGIEKGRLSISDDAIMGIIEGYTREAGVRGLERKIGQICRKAAKEIYEDMPESAGEDAPANEIAAGEEISANDVAAGEEISANEVTSQETCGTIEVTAANLEKYLGKVRYLKDEAGRRDEVGIVRGLAWTAVGGKTLEIEVNIMPGKGDLILTGKLGDVMKESARIGLSYVRSIADGYGIDAGFFKTHDFHIHIPEGATPKDGPSAGITMATAMLSALTDTAVRCDTAMTGELTLRGRVLPIGGLKEKLLAAKMAGIKQVLVPDKNRKDVEELEEEITRDLSIVFVESMEQVIKKAMRGEIKTSGKKKAGKSNGNKKCKS